MQAHNNNVEEFLGAMKTVFVVPVYQRNYDWQADNCKQLFHDIIRVIETKQEHFLGTICFKMYNSHERSIIDGQQRLTSITLLLKALLDFDNDEEIRSEINDNYLYNRGRGMDTDFLKYKLHLNKRDDAVYHILLENTKSTVEDKLSYTQKNSRLYQNYLLFYELLEEYVANGGEAGDILETLRSLTIIELEIQQENPQEIFESLNSTGLDLSNVDLLRNYFLMQFSYDTQTKLYEDYWSKIEDNVGVDRMEQLFIDYLVFKKRSDAININGRRNHITERTLYIAFKDHYNGLPFDTDLEKTESCFADLKDCSELYKNFVFSDDVNLDKETPMRRKLYYLLMINDSSKARSLLLYIFQLHHKGSISDEMLTTAVDAIASLSFRARICNAKGINRQFAGSVMQRLDEIGDYSQFVDLFWQAITIGKGSYAFPTDAEFFDALIHKDLYLSLRSRGVRYLLYMLESHSPYPKGLPAFDDESMSIEHIMPQTLNAQWKLYLTKETMQNYESSLHRLGNLALTNYNGEMSNRDFAEKKVIYKDSKFYYTTRILQYNEWQISDIDDRSKKLAQEALKIWQLPDQYQTKKAVPESLHTLGEDPSQFTYTKPSVLLIGNLEYSVSYWADFLPILCKVLDQENHDVLMQIATSGRIAVFGVEDDIHKFSDNNAFIHVTENVYMRLFMSAASILNTALRLTSEFDELAGTDYAENFLFALK